MSILSFIYTSAMASRKTLIKQVWHMSLLIRLLASISLLIGIASICYYLYDRWETYRDRPLGQDFTYVGREYQSGCSVLFLCVGPRYEIFYYETDVNPDQIATHFSNWSETAKLRTQEQHGDDYDTQKENVLLDHACKLLFHTKNQQQSSVGICYIKDKLGYIQRLNLKSSQKKYLVSISADDYAQLH